MDDGEAFFDRQFPQNIEMSGGDEDVRWMCVTRRLDLAAVEKNGDQNSIRDFKDNTPGTDCAERERDIEKEREKEIERGER